MNDYGMGPKFLQINRVQLQRLGLRFPFQFSEERTLFSQTLTPRNFQFSLDQRENGTNPSAPASVQQRENQAIPIPKLKYRANPFPPPPVSCRKQGQQPIPSLPLRFSKATAEKPIPPVWGREQRITDGDSQARALRLKQSEEGKTESIFVCLSLQTQKYEVPNQDQLSKDSRKKFVSLLLE